jgi:anthranilate synthase component 1
MYSPTLEEVKQLSRQCNTVPVYRELPADLDTPVSVYLKLRGEGPSFLLESVEQGEQVGRYSFVGVDPTASLIARGDRVQIVEREGVRTESLDGRDPLHAVADLVQPQRSVALPGMPGFLGGAVGYLGYDMVRFFEPKLQATAPSVTGFEWPEAVFLLADALVVFDHVRHRLLVVTNAHLNEDVDAAGGWDRAYGKAVANIESLVERLRRPLPSPRQLRVQGGAQLQSNLSRADYESAVRKAKEYIAAGDIFQVVLSQRLQRFTGADPFSIYRALRMLNPSPYMFYLELTEGLRLIGSSPEMLVRLEDGLAEVRPLAGTRPRGHTLREDATLARELLSDPKERAEHVMLVDLGRNDLGRVCRHGSVHVPLMMDVERYSHVMHIVSKVVGDLDSTYDAFDLMRATFPAGTVSGAPKVRAMEIIDELEGERRGPYAGSVGYFSYSGNMDTCITIRTIFFKDQTALLQAGAGIVADSDPAREYEETLHKAQALAEAIDRAERQVSGGSISC